MQILDFAVGNENKHERVDLLILGAGWTSTFLIPLLTHKKIKYAATTRNGRDNTIRFQFDPELSDPAPFNVLPEAETVLITFPPHRTHCFR